MKNLLLACVSSYAILTSINTPVFSTMIDVSLESEEEDFSQGSGSGVFIKSKIVQEFPNNDNNIPFDGNNDNDSIVSSSNHDDQGALNNVLNVSSSDSEDINISQVLQNNKDNELKFITDSRSSAFKGEDDHTNNSDLSDNIPQNQENDEYDLEEDINFPINSDSPEEEIGLSDNEQIKNLPVQNDYYSDNYEEDEGQTQNIDNQQNIENNDLENFSDSLNDDNNDQDKKIIDSFDFQSSNQEMPLFHDSLISTDPTNYNKKREFANEFSKDVQNLLDLNNNGSKADNIDLSSDSYDDFKSDISNQFSFKSNVIQFDQVNQENNVPFKLSSSGSYDDFKFDITRSQSKESIESCSGDENQIQNINNQQSIESNVEEEDIKQTQNDENNEISHDLENSGDDRLDNQQDENLENSSDSLNDDNKISVNNLGNNGSKKVIEFDKLDDPAHVPGNPPAHVPFVSNFSYSGDDRINNQQTFDNSQYENNYEEDRNQTQNDENNEISHDLENSGDDRIDNQQNNDLENSSHSLNENNDQQNFEDEDINQTQNDDNNGISFDSNINSDEDRIDDQQNILDIPNLLEPTDEEQAYMVQIFGQAINRAIITPRLQATINNVPVENQQEIQDFLNYLFDGAHNQLQGMEEYTQGLREFDNYFAQMVLQKFDGTPSKEEFTRQYFGFITNQNDYLWEFTRFLGQQAFEKIFNDIRAQIDQKAQGFIQLMNDDQPEGMSIQQLNKQSRQARIKKIQESRKQRLEAEKQNEAKGTQPAKKTSSASIKPVKKVVENKPEVVEIKTEAPKKKSVYKAVRVPIRFLGKVKETKNEVVENTPIKVENKLESTKVEVKTEAPKKKSVYKAVRVPIRFLGKKNNTKGKN